MVPTPSLAYPRHTKVRSAEIGVAGSIRVAPPQKLDLDRDGQYLSTLVQAVGCLHGIISNFGVFSWSGGAPDTPRRELLKFLGESAKPIVHLRSTFRTPSRCPCPYFLQPVADQRGEVAAKSDWTVGRLKEELEEKFPGKIPASLQRLFKGTQLLHSEMTLEEASEVSKEADG